MALKNLKEYVPPIKAHNNGILKVDQIELVERNSAPSDGDLTDGRIYHHTGTGLKVREGGAWVQLGMITVLRGSTTWNVGSLADGAGETKSLTVTGAEIGDFVLVSAPVDLKDMTVTGYVQAANTVEIRVQNESGNTVDLASGTWRVLVIKK